MISDLTMHQAKLQSAYEASSLLDTQGRFNPLFVPPGCDVDRFDFAQLMDDPASCEIQNPEALRETFLAEQALEPFTSSPLDGLTRFIQDERARELFLEWLALINVDLEPWGFGGAFHARPHWVRVLVHALCVGIACGVDDAGLDALCAAAAFHDTRRVDPYRDTGHGKRAAEYYAEFCEATTKPNIFQSEKAHNLLFDSRTAAIIAWHDCNDDEGMAAIAASGLPEDTNLLYQIFKDADGLDRIRLCARDFDASYLRTSAARKRCEIAQQMFTFTCQKAPR